MNQLWFYLAQMSDYLHASRGDLVNWLEFRFFSVNEIQCEALFPSGLWLPLQRETFRVFFQNKIRSVGKSILNIIVRRSPLFTGTASMVRNSIFRSLFHCDDYVQVWKVVALTCHLFFDYNSFIFEVLFWIAASLVITFTSFAWTLRLSRPFPSEIPLAIHCSSVQHHERDHHILVLLSCQYASLRITCLLASLIYIAPPLLLKSDLSKHLVRR